ncbi:MAG: selenocysteine-specific translation elongation factor [Planctomycetes bacterium]|nr:selenocysteine-specific translation elongation factor [Planctomycetota bacterium]
METKARNIMLGTAGHVDHGKTALVKMLTGCDTDRLPEEKKRGMTIELGFAPCRMTNERIVGIVDVPGHADFVRNMAAGAHGIDVVILIVAADDGVMPQTREHMDILTLLGVRRGLVALTKIDLLEADLRPLAVQDVRKFLAGTFLADAPICPVSNITGEGFDEFLTRLNELVGSCPDRTHEGLFRMWVERTFAMHGFGTVVSGIPTAGRIVEGQKLLVQPGGRHARVRRLEVYGAESKEGFAGQCVAANLTDIAPEELGRGMVLCQDDTFRPATMIEASLHLLPHVPAPLKDYTQVHFHIGTVEHMANVALLEDKELATGREAMVQFRLAGPVSAAPGERFIVRTSLSGLADGHVTTIGGGRILSAGDKRLRRNRQWTIDSLKARLAALDKSDDWLELMVRQHGGAMGLAEIARLAGFDPQRAAEICGQLAQAGRLARAEGQTFVHPANLAAAKEAILKTMDEFHAANPLRQGIEQESLAGLVCRTADDATQSASAGAEGSAAPAGRIDKPTFAAALAELIAAGKLVRAGSVLALAGRGAKVSQADVALCDKIEKTIQTGGFSPPDMPALAVSLAITPARLDAMVRLLADGGKVVRLDDKVVMHSDAVEKAKKIVLGLFARANSFETVEFRDAVAVSRKYAVPLLDYLDSVKFTSRSGNRRTPGQEARKLLAKP